MPAPRDLGGGRTLPPGLLQAHSIISERVMPDNSSLQMRERISHIKDAPREAYD